MNRLYVIGLAGLMVLCEAGCAGSGTADASGQRTRQGSLVASQAGADGAVTTTWVRQYGSYTNHGEAAWRAAQADLDRLRRQDPQLDAYASTKSQCWLNVARQEIATGDRWGNVGEAVYESERINRELAQGTPEDFGVPALRTVRPVRPDLVARLREAAGEPATERCPHARRLVACGEVMLVYAGHLAWESDRAAAQKMVGRVEQLVHTLDADLKECVSAVPQAASPLPEDVHSPASEVEKPVSVLFAFDRSDFSGMLPQGEQVLDGLLARLAEGPRADSVDVVGYTDRLGPGSYNLQLSAQRARTVAGYLSAHGLQAPVQAAGLGRQAPLVDCRDRDTGQLIRCLQPNRRVEITVHGK